MPTTQLSPHDGENETLSAAATSFPPSDAEQAHSLAQDGLAAGPVGNGATDDPATPAPIVDPISAGETAAEPPHGLGARQAMPSAISPGVETVLASEPPGKLRLSDAEQIAQERLDGAAEGSLAGALAIAPIESPVQDAPAFGTAAPAPAAAVDRAASPGPEQTVPEPIVALRSLSAEVARVSVEAVAELDAGRPDMREPGVDPQTLMEAAVHPEAVAQPLDAAPDRPVQEPLSSALDAAAKLAADANAAAQALEGLQRLLERQLPTIAPGVAAALPGADAAGRSATALPSQPPPLPATPPQARDAEPGLREAPALQPQPRMLVPQPVRMPAERVRLDVRGFLAGFALSWAFGIVLYLFMTAG
jgi:hypothetical protein